MTDGRGGLPVRNAAVLIENNKIRGVGPLQSVAIPEGEVSEIDAQGGYILPGLIDTLVHLMSKGLDLRSGS